MDALKQIAGSSMKENKPQFTIGDTVKVHCRIKEGDKERIQLFEGTVIAQKHGGIQETFTVRRIAHGCPSIPPTWRRSRLSAAVMSAGRSCTTCVIGWARPPRLRPRSTAEPRLKPLHFTTGLAGTERDGYSSLFCFIYIIIYVCICTQRKRERSASKHGGRRARSG